MMARPPAVQFHFDFEGGRLESPRPTPCFKSDEKYMICTSYKTQRCCNFTGSFHFIYLSTGHCNFVPHAHQNKLPLLGGSIVLTDSTFLRSRSPKGIRSSQSLRRSPRAWNPNFNDRGMGESFTLALSCGSGCQWAAEWFVCSHQWGKMQVE